MQMNMTELPKAATVNLGSEFEKLWVIVRKTAQFVPLCCASLPLYHILYYNTVKEIHKACFCSKRKPLYLKFIFRL